MKITIKDECLACGTCAALVPEVFEVVGTKARVKKADLDKFKEKIMQAKEACPVGAIVVEE